LDCSGEFARIRTLAVACCILIFCLPTRASDPLSAAQIAEALGKITVDPQQTYHVRDLQIARGDIKIYLTDGVLGFAAPVAGHAVAAVFSTAPSETGDAEVLLLPPQRSERASLASFINSPNLDEHFGSALFVFSDETANELKSELQQTGMQPSPDMVPQLGTPVNSVLRSLCRQIEISLIESLLDNHRPADGFFYAVIGSRRLGSFDLSYRPDEFEPVSAGQTSPDGKQFKLWSSFRPRRSRPFTQLPPEISDYRIDATIRPDLSLSATADFKVRANPGDGRVLSFDLSDHLQVESASINGEPAEIFQQAGSRLAELKSSGMFLIVSPKPLQPGIQYQVQVRYYGSVIRQTVTGYFVDDRTSWYPFRGPMLTTFDLTFHCPAQLHLVSTGEPISDEVADGTRTVHRKTPVPEALAGFNLGDYSIRDFDQGRYHIELDAEQSATRALDPNLAKETADVLDQYTGLWSELPIRCLSISPIDGYFGQGFPGLIYLSNISYMRPEDRPAALRESSMDVFFSDLLLPHEVAHQWWGNIVRQADYRTGWLTEAMANDSALQYLERIKGRAAVSAVLNRYREELAAPVNGKPLESAGPVDFGQRLIETAGLPVWHVITYEKGVWILRMLRQRLGDDGFTRLQLRMLRDFAAKPISNEDFRELASDFVPEGQPDKSLALFFDTWVYSTGIPKLTLHRAGRDFRLDVSGVNDDFSADVPLHCQSAQIDEQVHWVRAVAGSNAVHLPRAAACSLPATDEFLYQP
jgi:hypothetical protein